MYRTIFGMVISLKLFLGRFDMRTMQVGQMVSWQTASIRQLSSVLLPVSHPPAI